MPEIVEVEWMTRKLRTWAQGKVLTAVHVRDPKIDTEGALAGLEGRRLDRVWRRGKHSVATFGERSLVLHFRMTGTLVGHPVEARACRLQLQWDGGGTTSFVDTRRFGTATVMSTAELAAHFSARLGPEPWPECRAGRWWAGCLAGLRGPIKPALMKQDRVAGLGNIAATESCHRAGLDPTRPVPGLGHAEWDRLATGVRAYIEDTLAAETGEELRYVQQGGKNPFMVYGRGGQPCPRCGAAIVRVVQSGRATYFCAGCQA